MITLKENRKKCLGNECSLLKIPQKPPRKRISQNCVPRKQSCDLLRETPGQVFRGVETPGQVFRGVYHLWRLTIFAYTYMVIIHFLFFHVLPLFCRIESNARCLHTAQVGMVGSALLAGGQSTVGLNRSERNAVWWAFRGSGGTERRT